MEDKIKCQYCDKLLSAKYIKTHIKKQHPDKVSKKSSAKPPKKKTDDPSYKIPKNKLSEVDVSDFVFLDSEQDEEEQLMKQIFELDMNDSSNKPNNNSKTEKPKKKRNQPELAVQKKLEKK